MQTAQVLDMDGRRIGTHQRTIDTHDGAIMLITREKRLGGGTLAVPAREAVQSDGAWCLPYCELSILEAPPYSMNVDPHAYFEFWQRLGAGNLNSSVNEYIPTGSGPVHSDGHPPDDRLQKAVTAAIHDAAGQGLAWHMVSVTVKRGTVLLQGYQNDTAGRLSAAQAAASVPGVKEIVNMLIIRAL